MTRNRMTRGVVMLTVLCALVLAFAVPAANAASYSKVYGKTMARVRVRESASTNATIIDNIVKDACVYVTESKTSGSLTFVNAKYRASDGTVAEGWICQQDGDTAYVSILSAEQAKKSFGVKDGDVPKKVVGTFTSAQRKASKANADSTYVKEGSSGANVRDIQTKLKALGYYYAEITGNVGPKTETAIKAFQRDNGLTADGIAGPKTVAKIDAVYASKNTSSSSGSSSNTASSGGSIRLGSQGSSVSQLQTDLKTLGFYAAEITGEVGPKTETAIRNFQRKHGLSADGIAGKKTLAAIAEALKNSAGTSTDSAGGTTGSTASSGTALRLESTGSAVSALQQNLTTLGLYAAEITGHYGEKTEAAVRKFQTAHGLSADGIAGAKTLAAIADAIAGKGGTTAGSTGSTVTSLREGDRSSAVTDLQNRLTTLGYYYGTVTGHYGTLTKQAVRKFQEAQGLTIDGIAGAVTLSRLRSLTGGSSGSTGSTGSTGTTPNDTAYGKIIKDNVYLRTKASTGADSKPKASLKKGTIFRITNTTVSGNYTWYYISVQINNATMKGYVRGDMMQVISASDYDAAGGDSNDNVNDIEYMGILVVTAGNVNMRESPSFDADAVGTAARGAMFYYMAKNGEWYQLANDLWVHQDYVRDANNEEADQFISTGASFGGPYVQGDTSNEIRMVQEALKALGYYSGDITGTMGSKTAEAVRQFQRKNSIPADMRIDRTTYNMILSQYLSKGGSSGATAKAEDGYVYDVDWFTYKTQLQNAGLKRGAGKDKDIVLTDLRTGKSMYIYVEYTGNHADVEPLTSADTYTLYHDIFGVSSVGAIPATRRPMMVSIYKSGTVQYQFVCSIYGQCHGDQTIYDNGYNGQFCLHFRNSKTSGTGVVNQDHQNAINEAITILRNQGVTVKTFTGLQ